MDVWRQEGGAVAVSLAAVGAEAGQPLLHELLEHREGALATRVPLQATHMECQVMLVVISKGT